MNVVATIVAIAHAPHAQGPGWSQRRDGDSGRHAGAFMARRLCHPNAGNLFERCPLRCSTKSDSVMRMSSRYFAATSARTGSASPLALVCRALLLLLRPART